MKKVLIAVVILGLVGCGGYGVYHHFFENKETGTERVSSTSEDAVYVDLVSTITGYGSGTGVIQRYGGKVEPQETLEIKLDSDRSVKECFVKEGDDVEEGQRLFVYETQEDEDKLAQAQIDIEKAQGDIEVAQKQIDSFEKAKAKANADEQLEYTTNIMTQQTAIKQSEYEIRQKELEVTKLRKRIADATVKSEMAGVIQKISDNTENNSYYYGSDSGSNAYITILSAGDFRIKGSVNEQNLNDLQNMYDMGSMIIVYSRVDSSQQWTGMISEIKTDKPESEDNNNMYSYGNSGAASSSYAFYVELDSSDGLILGQHVYMEPDAGQNETKAGLWLDEYYIIQENGKAFVWRANKDNVLEKHEITLGEYDQNLMKYEVTSGLEADDYITMPLDDMKEGAPVIYNDAASEDEFGDLGEWSDDGEGLDGSMEIGGAYGGSADEAYDAEQDFADDGMEIAD